MKMIEVACCVFPDATVFWTNDVKEGPARVMAGWKSTLTDERRAALDDALATLGVVIVRMPEDAYFGIQTKNDAITAALLAGETATAAGRNHGGGI